MALNRFIPCLLLRDEGLVKTIGYKHPRYVGDPINTVRIFNEKEVDEIIFLDIDASPQRKEPNYGLLAKIADECFMPLAYGGGVRSFEQAQRIYSIGIEKIIINTPAHEDLNLIKKITEVYGSQAVVGVIDVKKNFFGKYQVVSNSASTKHRCQPLEWLHSLEEAGVGEVMLTSVDREGTWAGFDIELIKQITSESKVPIIAHGGAGTIEHIHDAVKIGKANAVALGSMVVYQKKDMGVLINFPERSRLPV